jgi:hypothetical protein
MWRLDWIQGLAEFCLERGCRFDAVSWHDLPDDMHSLPRLSARVETTRALLAEPRYQSLGVREIHVNEIMGRGIQFMPGAAVGYFSELESAGADVAIKSCWPDSSGRVNCEGQTLDGLLDWDTGRPDRSGTRGARMPTAAPAVCVHSHATSGSPFSPRVARDGPAKLSCSSGTSAASRWTPPSASAD